MRAAALLLAFAATAACASNDRLAITAEEHDDVAVSLAATLRSHSGDGDLLAMADAVMLAAGQALPTFSSDATGHHGRRAGIDYDYVLACRTTTGELVDCPGAISADIAASWAGRLVDPFAELAVERSGAWSLGALGSPVAKLDGDALVQHRSVITRSDRTTTAYTIEYAATYEDIELAVTDLVPRAGTIHYEIDAHRERRAENRTTERDFSTSAVVTFSGDGVAELVIDEHRAYRIELETGRVVAR